MSREGCLREDDPYRGVRQDTEVWSVLAQEWRAAREERHTSPSPGADTDTTDAEYTHPRLAALYDVLDPDRSDLDAYAAMAEEFGARRVLDIGCGTGVLALKLAGRGIDVVGVDPAAASLDVARAKPGAERVRWIHGDASSVPPLRADLVTMTANVAQQITDPDAWRNTLRTARGALRPGGHLVFETRVPARRAWENWNPEASRRVTRLPGRGATGSTVETWVDVTAVDGPLVSFRWTYVFEADGQVLTSDSTLRFRERAEIEADLVAQGYVVDEVRDAPDRPGREFVFVARRPGEPS
ncbi:SAM-dependent methyltransferase [Streptomyces venezuelae]|uniref:SAM-dependent methyltransferase n=1 Tax=Streptomyces venezuelae TaxID=54571 RepID=A0A5P2C8I2_STRVZ|nr:SAM-dependent methyltransferase [Streptomyces venezuelae]